MRVIRADVAALGNRNIKAAAGLKEEFVHLHVGRKRSRMQRDRIGKVGIAVKDSARERLQKPALQLGLAARFFQCQPGEDAQTDRSVGGGARKQCVRHVIGLAESKRQRKHDVLAHAGDDRLGQLLRIVEEDRANPVARHGNWP
jgi:hypothetical protein